MELVEIRFIPPQTEPLEGRQGVNSKILMSLYLNKDWYKEDSLTKHARQSLHAAELNFTC
jgi:hypothetical protein